MRPFALVVASLLVSCALLFGSRAALSQQSPPSLILPCGTSGTGGGTYKQEGTYCTSSGNPSSRNHKAVENANENFMAWVGLNTCASCPLGQEGCERTQGVIPDPPFGESDCVFTYKRDCQGNPLKTLITATCTGDVIWIVSCDYCSGDEQ
jgi:hypothetical protein